MNPALTAALAADHSRELTTRAASRRALASQVLPRSGRRLAPRYRVTWTRVSLAMTDGNRRRSSWAIVISASRAR